MVGGGLGACSGLPNQGMLRHTSMASCGAMQSGQLLVLLPYHGLAEGVYMSVVSGMPNMFRIQH